MASAWVPLCTGPRPPVQSPVPHITEPCPHFVQGPGLPDTFKLVYYEARSVGTRVVGIQLERFLVMLWFRTVNLSLCVIVLRYHNFLR